MILDCTKYIEPICLIPLTQPVQPQTRSAACKLNNNSYKIGREYQHE